MLLLFARMNVPFKVHIRLEHLGNRHQDTASSYHELGISQWCMGKYECALDYHKKALSISLDVLGELNSVTADSYYELGKTYFCLEDYRASLRSHLHAHRTRLELLGHEHPDTAKSNHELGVTQSYHQLARTQYKMQDYT